MKLARSLRPPPRTWRIHPRQGRHGMTETSVVLGHPDGRALDIYRSAARSHPYAVSAGEDGDQVLAGDHGGDRTRAARPGSRDQPRLLPGYTSTYLQITRHNAGGHADQRAGEAAGLLLARQLPGATISRDGTDGTAMRAGREPAASTAASG